MERERLLPERTIGGGGDNPDDFDELEQTRQRLDGMNDAADRLLAAYTPIQAEQFLQQNRQSSAQ